MSYDKLVQSLIDLVLKSLVPVLFAITVVYFLWGVLKFIKSAGDTTARASGKKMMLFGIIGLAVMVSFWGIVRLLVGTLGGTSFGIPQF